ncbi:Signal transduction histidine kinase [Halanaeroarchaeum sp. HSR-CO]|uniref:sensor histidine kinase n=1 Tax=Halanaeroarchaeum sp. HSR-CO TaxID=2866382 RepID=UPI00217D47BF|nr:ATP-binding protein [Halanaeroarchaeum sp. HSR-CO]UWG46693.1 Signal transduction histidine kinase [Halanaeroarchaeum sp. HSR-CO]
MKSLKRRQIGWKATGNLLVVFALLTLSVGSSLWMLSGRGGVTGWLQQFLVAVELIGLVAIAGMAYYFHVQVLRPLDELTTDAAAVAEGDLHRDIVAVDRNDEVGSLTRSVREMRDQLLDLVEEARTFQRAVEETGHSVIITDSDETIQYVNPAFEQNSGFTEAEALGRTPRIVKSGATDDAVYAEMWETLERGETWRGELINQNKAGERRYIRMTISPIEGADGSIDHYVSIGADVTTHRLRNQVLEVYNRVLRHNLRNRLNVVVGNAELVKDTYAKEVGALADAVAEWQDRDRSATNPEPETDRTLQDIAARLEDLAERIRDHTSTVAESASRLEAVNEKAGKAEQITQVTEGTNRHKPLDEHLEQKCGMIARAYPEVDVSISVPDSTTVPAPQSLRTAISELIENAIEHNDSAQPHVAISLSVGADRTVIRVEDDGPGIPDHEKAVLREGEETPLAHGSGLGLWLVYWIVTMNGGRLEISDSEPRGTVVEIDLPKFTDASRKGDMAPVPAND